MDTLIDGNFNFIKTYAQSITVKRLLKLKDENKVNNIAIVGTGVESRILKQCCEEAGIKVVCMIEPQLSKKQNTSEKNIFDWRAFFEQEFDACIIADAKNQKRYADFIKFCQLEKKRNVYSGFNANVNRVPITLLWDNAPYLFYAFSFARI